MSRLVSLTTKQAQILREGEVSSAILGVVVGSTRVPRELLSKERNIVSGPLGLTRYSRVFLKPSLECSFGVQLGVQLSQ